MAKEFCHEELLNRIEESKFFKKYGCKGHWLYVAPITDWKPNNHVVIKIDSLVDHNGMTNSFKAMFKELAKDFPLKDWHYNKNDGSCPQEYVICYE